MKAKQTIFSFMFNGKTYSDVLLHSKEPEADCLS